MACPTTSCPWSRANRCARDWPADQCPSATRLACCAIPHALSPTPTSRAWCTATSNPTTSCSLAKRRWSPPLGLPRPSAPRAPRPLVPRSHRWAPPLGLPRTWPPSRSRAIPTSIGDPICMHWAASPMNCLPGTRPLITVRRNGCWPRTSTEPPRPVQELRLDYPPALAELVMQLLAKDPNARPASAVLVAQALNAVTTSGASPPWRRR